MERFLDLMHTHVFKQWVAYFELKHSPMEGEVEADTKAAMIGRLESLFPMERVRPHLTSSSLNLIHFHQLIVQRVSVQHPSAVGIVPILFRLLQYEDVELSHRAVKLIKKVQISPGLGVGAD